MTPKHIPAIEILVGQGVIRDHIARHRSICTHTAHIAGMFYDSMPLCKEGSDGGASAFGPTGPKPRPKGTV